MWTIYPFATVPLPPRKREVVVIGVAGALMPGDNLPMENLQ
jgi:hypothetical protein